VTLTLPLLLTAPWILLPVATVLRALRSRSLDEESRAAPADAPLVSLVIPARNEAHNISRCVRSALAADYPALEVIVVDDHSTDDTGAIAHALAATDARLRVLVPAPLPAGWFGKQWACTAGAGAARGEILGFLDADTWQAPDLVPRVVNAMRSRRSDLLSVGGSQELGSFWERIVQPQLFSIMFTRYGGTEVVNDSRRVEDKIANGQCLFVRRDAYDALGGHEAVRDRVAEDLALAQRFFAHGRRTTVVLGLQQLTTRMYTSLRELVEGWGKNVYAGGRDSMPFGAVGRLFFPVLLVCPALSGLVPPLLLVVALAGLLGRGALAWAAIVSGVNLLWWLVVYRGLRQPLWYALLYPLGAAVLLYITVRAIVRGRRVEWKGRLYRVA
jgi:chlorobactene glucosyltransferase